MITIEDVKENKKSYLLPATIIIIFSLVTFFIVIIYYWIAMDSVPKYINNYFLPEVVKTDNNVLPEVKEKEPIAVEGKVNPDATKVIKFAFPTILPKETREGVCLESSLAQPFRKDAFKCTVATTIYDPCFSNEKKDKVICQMNPLQADIFVINLTKELSGVKLPAILRTNWAWFLELEDGTICSPYTGGKPLINNIEAFYGCKAKVKGDLDVLMGDLTSGEVWTAMRMIVTKDAVGTGWDTKSSEIVKIKTIWQ
jgi:hypothetical protein